MMAKMIGPLPATAFVIIAIGAAGIWWAGRDLNRSTTSVSVANSPADYSAPVSPFKPRFGEPNRHLPVLQTAGGELLGGEVVSTPGLPQTDVAAPPYAETTVFAPTFTPGMPFIQYAEAGDSDNLYTISVRNY